jgi:hypothetical protein
MVWFIVFKATFNDISVISWRSVLLVEETRVPGEFVSELRQVSGFLLVLWFPSPMKLTTTI